MLLAIYRVDRKYILKTRLHSYDFVRLILHCKCCFKKGYSVVLYIFVGL